MRYEIMGRIFVDRTLSLSLITLRLNTNCMAEGTKTGSDRILMRTTQHALANPNAGAAQVSSTAAQTFRPGCGLQPPIPLQAVVLRQPATRTR